MSSVGEGVSGQESAPEVGQVLRLRILRPRVINLSQSTKWGIDVTELDQVSVVGSAPSACPCF